jgi:DNA-binding transcriptional MerR regulator
MRRKSVPKDDFFNPPMASVLRFGAGEVADILGIESWRLQKYLSGKTYQLSSEGHIGKGGQGSRRLFSVEDICRIGIADFLTKDGFSPKWVSSVLQQIEDQDLLNLGPEGQSNPPVIAFRRDDRKRIVQFGSAKHEECEEPYYVLNTSRVIAEVNRRIRELLKEQRS